MKRIVLQLFLCLYIGTTTIALGYAFVGQAPAGAAAPIQYSWGMMAPYQGYHRANKRADIQVVLEDGSSQELPLAFIYPFAYPEQVVRSYHNSFRRYFGDNIALQKYSVLAKRIYTYARSQKVDVQKVTMTMQEWPVSPEGTEYLRKEPFVESTFLSVYP